MLFFGGQNMNYFMIIAIISSIIFGLSLIIGLFGIIKKRSKIWISSLIALTIASYLLINDYRAMINTTIGSIEVRDSYGRVVNIIENTHFSQNLLGIKNTVYDENGNQFIYYFHGAK